MGIRKEPCEDTTGSLWSIQQWGKLERFEGRSIQEVPQHFLFCVCVWANRGQSCQKTAYQLDEKQWGEVKLTPFKPYDWFELFIHSASVFQSSKGRCQRGREEGVQKGCDNQGSLWIWNKFGFLCKIWPLLAALFDKSNTSLRYLTGIKINNRVFQVLDI